MKNLFVILSLLVLVGCGYEPKFSESQIKMADWPGVYLKEVVEWYMPNASWKINDTNSVDVSGVVPFRGENASLLLNVRRQLGDSLWSIAWNVNGHPADSVETADLFDDMARASAKGIVTLMIDSWDVKYDPESFSAEAKEALAKGSLKCIRYVKNPKKVKTMPPQEASASTIDLAECSLANTSNPELIAYWNHILKISRFGLIAYRVPQTVNRYADEIWSTDSIAQNVLRAHGVNVDSLIEATRNVAKQP